LIVFRHESPSGGDPGIDQFAGVTV
jgi:hypothetical protein